jgi:hypothetical protein
MTTPPSTLLVDTDVLTPFSRITTKDRVLPAGEAAA